MGLRRCDKGGAPGYLGVCGYPGALGCLSLLNLEMAISFAVTPTHYKQRGLPVRVP